MRTGQGTQHRHAIMDEEGLAPRAQGVEEVEEGVAAPLKHRGPHAQELGEVVAVADDLGDGPGQDARRVRQGQRGLRGWVDVCACVCVCV